MDEQVSSKLKKLDDAISRYVRPDTFPLAVRMLRHGEAIPEGVKVPKIAAEAVVGGAWQVLHHYIENDRIDELPDASPQLTYMLLTPFLGPKQAAEAALAFTAANAGAPAPRGESGA